MSPFGDIISKIHWVFIASICLNIGCAPSLEHYNYLAESPLFKKRVGVFYDRKIIGAFEGLDEHDSREYFTALVAAMSKYADNVTFVDMTNMGAKIAEYQKYSVKKPQIFSDSIVVQYLVPKDGTLKSYEDSLDFILIMQNLSSMQKTFTESEKTSFLLPRDPFNKNGLNNQMNLIPTLHAVESDSQEVSHLGYILWDFKAERILGYDENSLSKQKFMDNSTTFAQDAEISSQRILKELLNVRK